MPLALIRLLLTRSNPLHPRWLSVSLECRASDRQVRDDHKKKKLLNLAPQSPPAAIPASSSPSACSPSSMIDFGLWEGFRLTRTGERNDAAGNRWFG